MARTSSGRSLGVSPTSERIARYSSTMINGLEDRYLSSGEVPPRRSSSTRS